MHLAWTNFQQMSNFHKLTGLPKQRKRMSKIIASGCNIFIPVTLASYRGSQCQVAIIYSPLALFWLTQPGKLPPLTKNGRVWFAKSCSNLIGQPFYKSRPILRRVASVAGASAAATLALPGRSAFPRPTKAGKPCGGEWKHTRVKAPSHRVAGLAVNCPLPGPPGLRSSLGGDCFHVGEQFSCTVCTQ